jgi:tetratricopeptide (TPR) repeat protein/tRNA A-37 threonylcarbamoyl transferase component Bud32
MNEFNVEGFLIDYPSIGKGCSGEVYRAASNTDHQECVVKRYNTMSVDRRLLERLLARYREMPLHSGIVNLKAYSFEKTPYYTVSEWADGVLLRDHGILETNERWQVIFQLADALGHAHKYGVIHGNLHPGNLFITSSKNQAAPRIRVADFSTGVLGDFHHLDLSENTYFAAPEQLGALGRNYAMGAAEKWDVYSFGVVAFWLLNDQFPRGNEYIDARAHEKAISNDRPVVLDTAKFVDSIYQSPIPIWENWIDKNEKEKNWREIITRCLELDPAHRPTDMREVRNLFRQVEADYQLRRAQEKAADELAEAEYRFEVKQRKQREKIITARASASILAISCFAASYFLLSFLFKMGETNLKMNKLGEVVSQQQRQITQLDETVEDTESHLRLSREALDSSFYKLTQNHGQISNTMDLERIRGYYLRVLNSPSNSPSVDLKDLLAQGRALHSLAHIEYRMSRSLEAIEHFQKAIVLFEGGFSDKDHDHERIDIIKRIGDCYEYVGLISENQLDHKNQESIAKAITYFKRALAADASDSAVAQRLATASFRYGQFLSQMNRPSEALAAYTDSAKQIQSLIKAGQLKENTRNLDEMLSKLQFHAAESFHNLKKTEEAIDAYIATIESIERLRIPEGYSNDHALMMARSFVSLGDIFKQAEKVSNGDIDQVYNEALLLTAPLNREHPEDVEVASLMCMILSRLAEVERLSGDDKDGYSLSVRGIESLVRALNTEPQNLEGFIALAEARLIHLEFLKNDPPKAKSIVRRGVDTAKHAYKLASNGADSNPSNERFKNLERLQRIFGDYSTVCKDLGENETALDCSKYVSINVSLQ